MEAAPVAADHVPAGQGEGTMAAAGQKKPAVQGLQEVSNPNVEVQLMMLLEGPCEQVAALPFCPIKAKLPRNVKEVVVMPTVASAAYKAGLLLAECWAGPVSCTAISTVVPLGTAFSV